MDKLSLALFEPGTLTIESLPAAVYQLEKRLDATTVASTITRALGFQGALEYILSAVSEPKFQLISEWLLKNFPTTVAEFTAPCVSALCLSRLATSMVSFDDSTLMSMTSSVILGAPVLKALETMLDNTSTFVTSTSSAQSRSKSKTPARQPSKVEEKPFEDFGVQMPSSRAEAKDLARELLTGQRTALQNLMLFVRQPQLRDILRDNYLVFGSGTSLDVEHPPENLIEADTFEDLQAYLSYPSPEGFGRWRILLTSKATKDFALLKKSGGSLYESAVKKLRDLSFGHFSPANHHKISSDSPVAIYKARLPGHPRIVYQVECIRESEHAVPQQALLVYGLYGRKTVANNTWDHFGNQQAGRGAEYIDACRYRSQPHTGRNDFFEPGEFPQMKVSLDTILSVSQADERATSALTKAQASEIHSLLVLGQHAVLSQNFFDVLNNGEKSAQIHQLSDSEREIVEHTSSCFLLGRSGTGKTTAMLFKIFGRERAWAYLAHAHSARPRQVFITRSSLLAKKVEREFIAFLKYDAVGEHAPAHFKRRIARSWNAHSNNMFSEEDTGKRRKDLPMRYSELTDEHFPLFITYDELCAMLENDLEVEDEVRRAQLAVWERSPHYSSKQIITYNMFIESYWSRLPLNLTRQTVPSVAYGEFLGVCEGSEGALSSTSWHLSRAEYEKRPVRPIDFALFEAFLRVKAQPGERDTADRTHNLLRMLQEQGFPGRQIDFLYVDEVQDNTVVEISLLRRLCCNANGLLWAGDTAQTISHGSAFRFDDLTSFLYRFEKSLVSQPSLSVVKPAFFQLSTNYRSPAGVVDCARSVVDLLKLFPRAIDILDREKGIVQGLRPTFVCRDRAVVAQDFFGMGANGKMKNILGHNQCILVRDEAARARLKRDLNLSSVGIVLSIYNSKGLEYDDILLYDFFTDSSVDSKLWRHLFEACGDLSGADTKRYAIDDRNHTALVTELKHLYVAITRARRNLWILETSGERSELMKGYWLRRSLIEDASPGLTLAAFAEPSAIDDWAQMAGTLFSSHNYEEAAFAYERASDQRRSRLCKAFSDKSAAGGYREPRRRREAYQTVASSLLACAAEASVEIKNGRDETQSIQNELEGISVAAADCFIELGEHRRAAEAFEQARHWAKAATHYLKAKDIDKAVALVKEDKKRVTAEIDARTKRRIIETAKCTYLEALRISDARELFEPTDSETFDEFIVSHDFVDARVQVLEERHEFVEAAKLLHGEGRVVDALRRLVRRRERRDCVMAALELGFLFLQAHFSLGSHTLPASQSQRDEISAAVDLLSRLPSSSLNSTQQQELLLFRNTITRDWAALRRSGILSFVRSGAEIFGLLYFDKYFSDMSHISLEDPHALINFVNFFGRYVGQMQELIMHSTLDTPHLLGIQLLHSGRVQLLAGSLVHRAYTQRHGVDASLNVQQSEALRLIRSELSLYLKRKVVEQLEKIQSAARMLEPCMDLLKTGECMESHDVFVSHELDEDWFNSRIQFHLQQIQILHVVHQIPHAEDFAARINQQMEWLTRLENALNPLLYMTGSQSNFNPSAVTVSESGMSIVKIWCSDVLFRLNPAESDRHYRLFMTVFLVAAKLGMTLDTHGHRGAVDSQLASVPCVADLRRAHPYLFERQSRGRGRYLLPFLSNFLRGRGSVQHAVEFLDVIVARRLSVDLGTLCNFADRLTGLFILTKAYRQTGSVHGVVLPQSWIVEIWPEFARYRDHNDARLGRFFDVLVRLLSDVHKYHVCQRAQEYLDISMDDARDICMARICRDISLLLYNAGSHELQCRFVQTIVQLGDAGWNAFNEPYLSSSTWADLASAAFQSCDYHVSDEIVQLRAAARRNVSSPVPGIREIEYRTIQDIPDLLGFTEQLSTTAHHAFASSSGDNDAPEVDGDQMLVENDVAAESAEPLAPEHAVREPQPALTDEEKIELVRKTSAARIIQEAWHWRREPEGSAASALHRQIREHRARARTLGLASTYRSAYIVHLPRLLLCAEHAFTCAVGEREKCKRERTRAAKDKDTDKQLELGDKIKKLMTIEKAVEKIRGVLRPESEVHTQSDALAELRKRALNVKSMFDVLPRDAAMDDALELVLWGVEHVGTRQYPLSAPDRILT